ncbi:UTRA domain-containing protein [bacterium]|nr:UTRA domain-containing protein [bacterium]
MQTYKNQRAMHILTFYGPFVPYLSALSSCKGKGLMAGEKSAIPKYFQINQDIVEKIQKGELAPGAKIPSENEIIDTYNVSNTTARKALHELEKNAWVTRIKGKGTYVRGHNVERSTTRILSFTKNMIEAGRKPSTQLVSMNLFEPAYAIAIHKRTYTLDGPICKVQRLRFGDNIPILFETRYISSKLCPDLHKRDLEKSLYDIYNKKYGLHLTEVKQVVSAAMMDTQMLSFFGLDHSVPAFRVEGITFCGKGLILEMEESIYRGDIYRFTVSALAGDGKP